jgi:HAMP domain-containing protein
MEPTLSRTRSSENPGTPSLLDVIERSPMRSERSGFLAWWYHLAAAPEPPSTANLKERETYRRSRLTALVSLIQIIVNFLLIPTVGLFVDHSTILGSGVVILVLVCACWVNRRGWTVAAGVIVVAILELLFFSLVLNPFGGLLSSYELPFLDALMIGVLFTVFLLPESAVFVVALVNSLFIVGAILEMPKTAELIATLQTAHAVDAFVRPIILQIIAAVVCYLWARSSRGALERADRATTIAALEHSLVQQGQGVARQKQHLEKSMKDVIETCTRIANGDLSARVPLPQDYSLWEVVELLNTVLVRLQHLHHAEAELQHVKRTVGALAETMRQSGGKPIAWPQTGTIFDTIAMQYNMLAQAHSRRQTG